VICLELWSKSGDLYFFSSKYGNVLLFFPQKTFVGSPLLFVTKWWYFSPKRTHCSRTEVFFQFCDIENFMKFSNKITKLVKFTLYQQNLPIFSRVFFLRYPQNVSKENNIVHQYFLHFYSNDQKITNSIAFHVLDFWKKNWFHKTGKILLKIHTLDWESMFFRKNYNIAKPYHMKIHWFEHTHDPNP
jgi:hypothetical protein